MYQRTLLRTLARCNVLLTQAVAVEEAPKPASEPAAAPSSSSTSSAKGPTIKEDPAAFKVGYNMGKLSVQLETMKGKLDDNRELLKSQLSGLRETSRTNHDALRRLQSDLNKQNSVELQEGIAKLGQRIDSINTRLGQAEEAHKELMKQQFTALQKHIDDRLENIKDLIKFTSIVLLAVLVWILLTLNNINHATQHHSTWMQVQSNSAILNKLATGGSSAGSGGGAHPSKTTPVDDHLPSGSNDGLLAEEKKKWWQVL